ncbi:MAG: DUF1643 domain-containing protein [Erythrobacter sp.]
MDARARVVDAGRRWPARHPGPAVYSPCGSYRYRLERIIAPGPVLGIVMTNPSRASAAMDDPTIAAVQRLCARFGFGRAIIGNLFAWATPDIAELARVADPVGPDDDRHLESLAREADMLVVAWGAAAKLPRTHPGRWREVADILEGAGKPLHCLTHLKGGHPRHPQILIHETPLPRWRRPG